MTDATTEGGRRQRSDGERSRRAILATATRLASLQSHRYAYWKVALGAFADHPLNGLGSGGFEVRWLERRKIPESVADAHVS